MHTTSSSVICNYGRGREHINNEPWSILPRQIVHPNRCTKQQSTTRSVTDKDEAAVQDNGSAGFGDERCWQRWTTMMTLMTTTTAAAVVDMTTTAK